MFGKKDTTEGSICKYRFEPVGHYVLVRFAYGTKVCQVHKTELGKDIVKVSSDWELLLEGGVTNTGRKYDYYNDQMGS